MRHALGIIPPPRDLFQFYECLYSDIKEDISESNQQLGAKAAKWLLSSLGSGILTQWIIDALSASTKRNRNGIGVEDTLYACHHSAEWKEESARFQFSHFSVYEFFTEQGKTRSKFGSNRIHSDLVGGFLNALFLKETFDSVYSRGRIDLSQSFQAHHCISLGRRGQGSHT